MSVIITRNELVETNLALVHYVARKFNGTKLQYDDLVSIGSIGLIKAADSFKEEKGVKFNSFAVACIRNEILMGLRKIKNEYLEVSFDSALSKNDENFEIHLADVIGTDPDYVHDIVNEKNVKQGIFRAIQKLDEREQLLVNRYMASFNNTEAPSQRDAAKMFGYSQSYISRLERKAIRKLGEILKSECIFA